MRTAVQEREGPPGRNTPSDLSWDAPLFVWGTWCLSTVLALVFALHQRRFPYVDDWYLVPVLAGAEPVTFAWLWAQHSVHRILLPRLLFLGLYNPVVGYDFRAGPVLSALLLSALAVAMIVVVRRLRGRTSYSDAFFPLALLHWGIEALNWNFGLQFLCSTVLASVFLLLIVRDGASAPLGSGLLAGSAVVLLPTTGANGVALAPCLILFLGFSAWRRWRQRTPTGAQPAAPIMASFALGAMLLCGLYFVGYRMPDLVDYASPSVGATLRTAVMFSAAGLGSGFSDLTRWPWWGWWRAAVPALLLLSTGLLVKSALARRSELDRVVGLLLFLAAFAALTVSVGHGRGGMIGTDEKVYGHYSTLALPILCFVYLVWEAYGSGPAKQFLETCLLCLMCVAFVLNGPPRRYLGGFNSAAAAVERDVRSGMTRCAVTARHLSLFWGTVDTRTSWGRAYGEREATLRVSTGLDLLARVGVAPFALFRDGRANDPC